MSSTSPSAANIKKKCIFFDMVTSNSATRIRLWLQFKGLTASTVETKMIVSSTELQDPEFTKINPLRKVPAFVTDNGLPLFESSVIMGYLEDRFEGLQPNLLLDTPEDRAFVNLIVRCHDLYICSANCNQPHFSHTQGCMYLDPKPTEFTPERRTMDTATRAAKLTELHEQLTWLEKHARLPYLAGDRLTHADLTWYPTIVMMQLMLPRSFGWPDNIFQEGTQHFPKISKWYAHCSKEPRLAKIRKDYGDDYLPLFEKGYLAGVRENVDCHPEFKWKYV